LALDTATRDLRALGPLEILDSALFVARSGGALSLARAWLGAAPLALCVLAAYYFERVEGVHSLRPWLALSLVLAWWVRALLLSAVARDYALSLRSGLALPEEPPRAVDIVCTASVVGIGVWVWLWPLAGAASLMPLSVAGVLPFVALRGAVAPSWLARASCARERGIAAFGQALDDTAGMRGVFLIVEMVVLFGAIAVFANAYALLGFTLLLGHALLGFDVSFVSSFLSPDNTFVLLLLSALTLCAIEPLRAAVSAHAFVNARSRRDGADLHAAVDAAIGTRARARAALGGERLHGVALVLAASAWLAAAPVHAQPEAAAPTPDAAPASEATAADVQVREHLSRILEQREFREFADTSSQSMRELFDKLFAWLDQLESEPDKSESSLSNAPALSPWLLMSLALLALIALAFFIGSARRAPSRAAAGAAVPAPALPPADPPSLFDEAARHAAAGDMRSALRALYLATLVALDRRRLIEYEPSKTNWHYLRSLPSGELRQAFAAFTRIFDHTWYGHEPATLQDYEQCRRLCERLCSPAQEAP
jgi:hypothetical protein